MNKLFKYLAVSAFSAAALAAVPAISSSAAEPSETAPSQAVSAETLTSKTTAVTVTSDTAAQTELTGTQPSEVSETTVAVTTTAAITSTAVPTESSSPFIPGTETRAEKGWNAAGGKWYYFDGEKFLTGVCTVDGEQYLFAYNGAMKPGWQYIGDRRCYFDNETHSPVYGRVSYMGHTYFNDRNEGKVTGMREIGDRLFIFDESGIMQTGFVKYGQYFYYCLDSGEVVFGDESRTPVLIGDDYYLIDLKGHVRLGWQTVNGKRVYFDYETAECFYGWVDYKGNEYYTDKEKGKYTGEGFVEHNKLRFDENGIYCKGFQDFKDTDGSSARYYYRSKGELVKENFVTDSGSTYYFDSSGKMVSGRQNIGGHIYRFADDGKMTVGFYNENGKTYYFSKDGAMQTGACKIDGTVYGFSDSGEMLYGWQDMLSGKYYFSPEDGKGAVGWLSFGSKTYHFSDIGAMDTGFTRVGEYTYYLGNDGVMRKLWQTIDGKKRYFGTDGKMRLFRNVVDGKECYFRSDGSLNTTGNRAIVKLAESQLGYEGGEKYWRWWGFDERIEWCACFISWCAEQLGYTQEGRVPLFISCAAGIKWFKEHRQWMSDSYRPKPGDYVFFDWECDGVSDHIGIVKEIEKGYLITLEGNNGDRVVTAKYPLDSPNIFGYAEPDMPDE